MREPKQPLTPGTKAIRINHLTTAFKPWEKTRVKLAPEYKAFQLNELSTGATEMKALNSAVVILCVIGFAKMMKPLRGFYVLCYCCF